MPKWKYAIHRHQFDKQAELTDDDILRIEAQMNYSGNMGWELVQFIRQEHYLAAIYKQPGAALTEDGGEEETGAPINVVPPGLNHSTTGIGTSLSCIPGSWESDTQIVLAFQWWCNGGVIPGEINSIHTATFAGTYDCRVTATNEHGSTVAVSSTCLVS